MRALTVRQPWATAIIRWGKSPENRTRNVAGAYRGPVAIHAGLREDEAAYDEEMIKDRLGRYDDSWLLQEHLVTGAFVGVVDLVDVHEASPERHVFDDVYAAACCQSPWAVMGWLDSSDPVHHLVVANPRPLAQPIPARGMLGLWTPPPAVLEQLQAVTR